MSPTASTSLAALLTVVTVTPVMEAAAGDHFHIHAGHVDFSFCRQGGEWQIGVVWEIGGEPVLASPADGPLRLPEQSIVVVEDRPFEEGARIRRPTDPRWAFTGVAAGEPLWHLPQGSWPGAWTGFRICADGCGSYFEADPRIRAEGAWRRLMLRSVRYMGRGTGHFSLWSNGPTGDPTVWMTTTDGLSTSDVYFVGAGGHAHPNMGFSSLGLYAVTFAVACGPAASSEPSPDTTFYFAVGTYWEWLSKSFPASCWFQPGQMGSDDDPDKDGVPNVLEFALGMHPRNPDLSPTTGDGFGGTPLLEATAAGLHWSFPMRDPASNPQVRVEIRSTSDPAEPTWPDVLSPRLTPGRPGWYAASCNVPFAAGSRRFLRMEATLLSSISYQE